MKAVGLRELKNRLSEYVREVRGGESVLVTDRGEVVAELCPPGHRTAPSDHPAGLQVLARRGLATLGQPREAREYPELRRALKPGRAAALLAAERGRPVTVYAESSAVLAWLLGEAGGRGVRDILSSADSIVTSDLTLVECDRVLHRAVALRELSEADAASRRAVLAAAAARWTVLRVGLEVIERARQPFAREPIRTLDAIHLASALVARAAVPDVSLLSLDDAVRKNGRALGLPLQPR